MSTDRRCIKRSRIKPKVAAAYLFGQAVKNIMADHGVTNYGNLYRTLAEDWRTTTAAQAVGGHQGCDGSAMSESFQQTWIRRNELENECASLRSQVEQQKAEIAALKAEREDAIEKEVLENEVRLRAENAALRKQLSIERARTALQQTSPAKEE